MISTLIVGIIALASVWFSAKTPLFRKYKFNPAYDYSVTAVGFMICVFHIYYAFILPTVEFEEQSAAVCGYSTPQYRCYNVPQDLCNKVWGGFEKLCAEEAKPIIAERGPSTLIGPFIKRCLNTRFDSIMFYNRKNSLDFYCSSYFEYLEKAKKNR